MSIKSSVALLESNLREGGSNYSIDFNCSKPTSITTFVNPFSYNILLSDQSLLRNVDRIYADGALYCYFHNFFNKKKISRTSFDYSSIAGQVLDFCLDNNLKLAVVGANSEELEMALKNIKILHEGINIVYSRNGYFNTESELTDTVEELKVVNPDILIVGMGTPLQEIFSIEAKQSIPEGILIFTCGGFISQTAIKPDYYTPFIKKTGLRWLQRFVLHAHVRKRVIKDYPMFCFSYIKHHLFTRK